MAVALQAGNLVWTKVKKHLANSSPATQGAFKALREYLVSQKGNPDLQLFTFSEAEADANDGTGLLSGASTIYAFYAKHEHATATAATTKLFESATVDTTSTEQSLSLPTAAVDQETFQIYPNGWAQVTGITVTQHTTIEGSSDASLGADGFVLIGAA